MQEKQRSSIRILAQPSAQRTLDSFRRLTSLLAPLAILTVAAAAQQTAPRPETPTVLVELFTSEGCSSCPPADRQLMELDRTQPIPGAHIVVLSEHVDYWNSLGWQDPFSSHQWSQRQEEYGRQFGLQSVYTPQMVVNGAYQLVGGDGRALRAAVEKSAQTPRVEVSLSNVSRTGNRLHLAFTTGASPKATLFAVVADDADQSSVQRGENAGRRLEHVAVARSLTRIADLDGTAGSGEAEIDLPASAEVRPLRLVLFARNDKTGHIVGVAERGL